jgi:predicted ATP-dependent endonuclease of OLD family
MSLRISKIALKAGKGNKEIQLRNITILVGPSNSGKSEFLRDLVMWVRNPLSEPQLKIISKVNEIDLPNPEDLEKLFSDYGLTTKINDKIQVTIPITTYVYKDRSDHPLSFTINEPEFRNLIQKGFPYIRGKIDSLSYNDPEINRMSQLFNLSTIFLNAEARFSLTEDKPMGDILTAPVNYLSKLFRDNATRGKISEIIRNEFGHYLYVIPSSGNAKILLNESKTNNPRDLSDENLELFKNSKPVNYFSDGTRAFIGIILAVYSLPHKVILIDDPEAFLHPPLAKSLGRYISHTTIERNSSLFVSTHSVDFLMGCLEASQDVTIIRLSYNNGKANSSTIPYVDLRRIMDDPLLRSNNVLNALFHKSAIVVEGNVDRVFYNEINSKILSINKPDALGDTIFINSVGKNVIHKIISPLKGIDIPVVSIYDFDILDERNENKGLFKAVLQINGITDQKVGFYLQIQDEMEQFVRNNHKVNEPDPYRKTGTEYFANDLKMKIIKMLCELKEHGVFINPHGTVERWLSNYGITGEGSIWLTPVLKKVLDISKIPDEDVWKFMSEIYCYIENGKT